MPAEDPTTAFPDADALCESCGYALRGLSADADCPECGTAVAESSPQARVGPYFDARPGVRSFFVTAALILFCPRPAFRAMRVDGSNRRARLFLRVTCLLAALVWVNLGGFVSGILELDVVVCFFVLYLLTYIEVLGVTAFSRRRGWRVPLRLAERVCCYASAGWLPGAVVAGGLASLLLTRSGMAWSDGSLGWVPVRWVLTGAVFVLAMLLFETLVWVGVRQVKFANPPAAVRPAEPTTAVS